VTHSFGIFCRSTVIHLCILEQFFETGLYKVKLPFVENYGWNWNNNWMGTISLPKKFISFIVDKDQCILIMNISVVYSTRHQHHSFLHGFETISELRTRIVIYSTLFVMYHIILNVRFFWKNFKRVNFLNYIQPLKTTFQ
jgi:hypothetical protein